MKLRIFIIFVFLSLAVLTIGRSAHLRRTFSANPVRDCRHGNQSAGKPSKVMFSTTNAQINYRGQQLPSCPDAPRRLQRAMPASGPSPIGSISRSLAQEVRHTAAGKKGGCDFPWLTQNPPLALDIGGSVTWCFLTSTAVARPRRQRQNSPSEAPAHDVDQATAGERP